MPTLFLMCGLPGTGKTTAAKRLEHELGALRLTPDEWIADLSLDPYTDAPRAAIEGLQWRFARRVLQLGIDVILDFGVWSRCERDHFRASAVEVGATTRVVFLDVDRQELLKRLAERNATAARGTFRVDEEMLNGFAALLERPAADELT